MTEEEQIQADIERFEQRSCDIPDDGDVVERVSYEGIGREVGKVYVAEVEVKL